MELTKEVIEKRNRKRYLDQIADHKKWLKENSTYAEWLKREALMHKMVREYDEGVNKIIEEENKKEDLK
ncbi:hypothetical protein ES695_01075 [Candidatus Atribacteria bacterium 1244-E10-H5-B2]|nr:MAG: hypothetical protein ES695_01075 [Candidatus Atribacteria bacterium 1244-E10-H5-B2]